MFRRSNLATEIFAALALASVSSTAEAGAFSAHVETSVDIAAPPHIVWQVLTEFTRYPDWNPHFQIAGVAQKGERLHVNARMVNSSRAMRFAPRVLTADGQQLRWRGRFILPGLFDGEHYFQIVEIAPGQVRFDHGEKFSGLFLPFARSRILPNTRSTFDAINAALKARAEQRAVEQAAR